MKRVVVPYLILLVFTACSIEPEIINYGSDMCHFCTMTIVDQQHSAQYVTNKGKQFKYDAIECMLNELSVTGTDKIGQVLVSDFSNPGIMINASQATYLISEEIKSPMGANLSAFSKELSAKEFIKSLNDNVYTWTAIKNKFDAN